MSEVFSVIPGTLGIHPSLKSIPALWELAEFYEQNHHGDKRRLELACEHRTEWEAFVGEIRESGIRVPLLVLKDTGGEWLVVDGRHRLRAANECGFDAVPCQAVSETERPGILMGTVVGRRHITKGARAYLGLVFNPSLGTNGAERRTENLRLGSEKSPNRHFGGSGNGATTLEGLSQEVGVSLRMIERAVPIFRILSVSETARKRHEPGVWSDMSLGAVWAGMMQDAGLRQIAKSLGYDVYDSPGAAAQCGDRKLEILSKNWLRICRAGRGWNKLDDSVRESWLNQVSRSAAAMPPEMIEALTHALRGGAAHSEEGSAQ